MRMVREKGYCAMSVDELCAAAGVTKGAFFHHFDSKEMLGRDLARHWSAVTGGLFASAGYHDHEDPADRILAYIDLRLALVRGDIPDFTCVAGTMAQEIFDTSPAIREACGESIFGHAATLEADMQEAIRRHGVTQADARDLALYTQAVIQGAFILAKAGGGAEIVRSMILELRRHFEMLFNRETGHGRQ